MGFEDLAVLVLHESRVGAVQDAGGAGNRERRAVAATLDARSRGLDPDQRHLGVVDKGRKNPDRVRPAAHAGQHAVGQPSFARKDLTAGFVADYPLQLTHERRIRSRADAGSNDVVGGSDVGHPVSDRGRDGLLERPGAGLNWLYARSEQTHALDVGLLAAHVLGAHVDDALEVQEGAGSRRGHPVLAGTGLGDDPALAHPPSEQRLAEGVVDLVGAGVIEVLALEIRPPTAGLAEPRSEVER